MIDEHAIAADNGEIHIYIYTYITYVTIPMLISWETRGLHCKRLTMLTKFRTMYY